MKTIMELCKEVQTGATNSVFEKGAKSEDHTHKLLTGAAITNSGEVNPEQLSGVQAKQGKDISKFLAKEGDVVLLAKGNSIRAAYITRDIAELNVVVSTNFISLRPNEKDACGELLVTYLNSEQGQSVLDKISTGAVMKNINLGNLKKLELPTPPLAKQSELAKLFHARNLAYNSALALAEQQNRVVDACMNKIVLDAA